MPKIEAVLLPHLGSIQLVIQSKRDIRAHEKHGEGDPESNEWFYWNRVWASEVALSEYLIQEYHPASLIDKTVLELGCGTGLAGLVSGKLGGVPTFSDKVPMVMDSIQEACRLNLISNYHTWVLDWALPGEQDVQYDLVLGSEIFYDSEFLEDICQVLMKVLAQGGMGLFCDPSRLGVEAVESCFSPQFHLTMRDLAVEWPRTSSPSTKAKTVLLYQMIKK
jgi:predicted nicotinamide N-methyase